MAERRARDLSQQQLIAPGVPSRAIDKGRPRSDAAARRRRGGTVGRAPARGRASIEGPIRHTSKERRPRRLVQGPRTTSAVVRAVGSPAGRRRMSSDDSAASAAVGLAEGPASGSGTSHGRVEGPHVVAHAKAAASDWAGSIKWTPIVVRRRVLRGIKPVSRARDMGGVATVT